MPSAFLPLNVQAEAMGSAEGLQQMVLIDSPRFNSKVVCKGKFGVSAE